MTMKYLSSTKTLPSLLIIFLSVVVDVASLQGAVSETAVSEKVKAIASAVRLRDQGAYREALEVLEQFRSKFPDDVNVNDLYFEMKASYDPIMRSGSASGSPQEQDLDDLIQDVIQEKEQNESKLIANLNIIRRNLDRGNLNGAASLINQSKKNTWVSDQNREDYEQLLELEKRLRLERALSYAELGEMELADTWLSDYRSDPSSDRTLKKLAAKVQKLISGESENQVSLARLPGQDPGGSDYSDAELQLFNKGKAQYLGGDFEGALATFRELEKRKPGSPLAKEYQLKVQQYYGDSSFLNRSKTRQEMLNEVDRSWQRPRIFSPETNRLEGENTANPLVVKIRSIKIPRVNFSNLELTTVIETLSELSVEFDTQESDPLKKGVNIVPLFDPNTRSNPRVSISLRNLSLEKILQFVTQQVNFQFDIVDEAVVVQPTDGPDGAANLLTEFFPISRATAIRLTGGASSRVSQVFSDNPFEVTEQEEAGSSIGNDESAIRGFFQRAGVEFEGIRGASLAFDGTQLIVTQTSRNLERMRNILRRYEKTRQVEIEAKFLEVQQEDLDELGFDWTVATDGKQMFDPSGNPLIGETGDPVLSYDTVGSTVNRSMADTFALNQSSKGIRITSPNFVGGQIAADFNAPSMPQSLDFAQSLPGGILSTVSILGDTELGVVIRALSRKEGSDLLSAPRLTVLSGKTANITVAQELRYPESYSDIQAEVSRGVSSAASTNGSGGAVAITAGTPQDFVVRNVGVEMEVTPTVEDNDNISLLLQPQVTEFEGFVEYGGPSVAISGDLTATVPSGFYQPIFSTRSVKTEVTIYDGATVVIGGLTREEVKTVDDKVPLLGDIPYLGRLFRSEGETSRKRNLLIFVTANLIGPGGGPIKQEFPEIEANSMFQNPTINTPGGGVNRAIPETEAF